MAVPARFEPIEILLVEDNYADVRLTQEVFKECKVQNHMSVARDGEAALQWLRREVPYQAAPRPGLILLDLNLPKMDGRAVLTELKSDAALRSIPVVVLTTSTAERDVNESYNLHANCYLSKPLEFDKFVSVVESIVSFWLTVVRLPQ
jgi:two-component system, chemotaxis family, response regulator Rcp1